MNREDHTFRFRWNGFHSSPPLHLFLANKGNASTYHTRRDTIKAMLADRGGGGGCRVEPIPSMAKRWSFYSFRRQAINWVFLLFSGRQSAADSMNHIYFSDLNPAVKS